MLKFKFHVLSFIEDKDGQSQIWLSYKKQKMTATHSLRLFICVSFLVGSQKLKAMNILFEEWWIRLRYATTSKIDIST